MRSSRSTWRVTSAGFALTLLLGGCAGAGTEDVAAEEGTAEASSPEAVAAVDVPLEAVAATGVPWCVPDLEIPGAELIVSASPDIPVNCSFRAWLLHQAGTTILVSPDGHRPGRTNSTEGTS